MFDASLTSLGVFYSPYNWYSDGSAALQSNNIKSDATIAITNTPGAYLKTIFTGSSFAIDVDVSAMVSASILASNYPAIEYSVDGGSWTRLQLTSSSDVVSLATGLTSGVHSIEVVFVGVIFNAGDRWTTPVLSLRISNIVLASGGKLIAPAVKPKRAMFYGDSFSEGYEVGGAGNTVANQNARLAWPRLLAAEMNAEYGVAGFASQGYFTAVAGVNLPSFANSWNLYSSGRSRLVSTQLPSADYVVIGHGTNDSDTPLLIETARATCVAIKSAVSAGKVAVLIPPGNTRRGSLLSAAGAVNDNSVFAVQTNTNYVTGENASGTHLSQAGQVAYSSGVWSLLSGLISESGSPVNVHPPRVAGSAKTGSTLTATTGVWAGSAATYTYQWLRNGSAISGETTSSYVTTASDIGTSVSVRVTATNSFAQTPADSTAINISSGWQLLSQSTGVFGGASVIDSTGCDLLIAAVSGFGASAATVSDTRGNTWNALTNRQSAAGTQNVRLFWCRPTSTGPNHAITFPSGTFPAVWFAGFSNSNSSPFDVQNGANTASGTSLQPGSVTPSQDNSLIVTAITYGTTAGTTAAVSGYTSGAIAFSGSVNLSLGYAWKVLDTAAADNPTWTWTPSQSNVVAAIAAFKPA